jgi:hypothetical protein
MRHADLDVEEMQFSLGAADWPEQIGKYSAAGNADSVVETSSREGLPAGATRHETCQALL